MRRLFYLVVFCFSSYSLSLSAERGMATVYDTHQSHKLFVSLIHIHYNLESSLPVEIWYSESDITKSDIDRFSQFEFVKMRSIPQNRKKDLLTVLDLCSFDEVIWFLPNIAFFYDPGLLFEDSWYKKTGAFFFNRQERLKHNKKEKVKKNKSDIITLSQKLEPYLNNIPFNIATKIFEKQKRFVSRYELIFSDFSLLVIDKISHRKNVLRAIDLTRDPFFISLKQNDLLWMAIVMNGCPFHQNFVKQVALQVGPPEQKEVVSNVQLYQGKILAFESVNIAEKEEFSLIETKTKVSRPLIDDEMLSIDLFSETFNYLVENS